MLPSKKHHHNNLRRGNVSHCGNVSDRHSGKLVRHVVCTRKRRWIHPKSIQNAERRQGGNRWKNGSGKGVVRRGVPRPKINYQLTQFLSRHSGYRKYLHLLPFALNAIIRLSTRSMLCFTVQSNHKKNLPNVASLTKFISWNVLINVDYRLSVTL